MNKLIEIALTQYGIKEIPGPEHEEQVLRYFDEIGHAWVNDDETPWCSAFANWVAMKANHERTDKLNARSWLDVGKKIITEKPQLGDVIIFWRGNPNGWTGHVAFYINEDDYNFYVLGGNQNNSVCILPYDKGRLLGIRRLKDLSNILPNTEPYV